jgi:hypothetical protein
MAKKVIPQPHTSPITFCKFLLPFITSFQFVTFRIFVTLCYLLFHFNSFLIFYSFFLPCLYDATVLLHFFFPNSSNLLFLYILVHIVTLQNSSLPFKILLLFSTCFQFILLLLLSCVPFSPSNFLLFHLLYVTFESLCNFLCLFKTIVTSYYFLLCCVTFFTF